jgi:heme/copper-type cytochrome/quinol oxidase subunit 2
MPSSNALDPQSPQARAIYELAIHSTIIFALIFVIVTGAIIYAILRFRACPDEPDPRQTGNRKKIPEMPAAKSLIGDRSNPWQTSIASP